MGKRRGKIKTRLKATFKEFRARLSMGTNANLIRVIKVLWPSASRTAKNKAIKIASMPSFTGKRSSKRKSKSKSRKGKSKRRSKGGRTKTITIKMKNGRTRKQKVKVLANGKLRFVKN